MAGKNLLYYSIGGSSEYAELLKMSIETVDEYNKTQDILIITDKDYFEKYLSSYDRKNLYYHFIDDKMCYDSFSFNRIKIFDYPNLDVYENLLYIDTDVWVNLDLNQIFTLCDSRDKLYVVVEDYDFNNHLRKPFNLGLYDNSDITFFTENNIHTFNSGLLLFKNSSTMKEHFEEVLKIKNEFKDDYFTDQPFLNYYFNTKNLTETKSIVPDKNYLYIFDGNIHDSLDLNNKICHFIGNTFDGKTKINKIKNYKKKMEKNFEHRDELIYSLNELVGQGKGVEIGVFKGDFSKVILENWGGTLYMVDVWKPLGEEYEDSSNHREHVTAYSDTMNKINGLEDRGVMIRATSKIASEIFEDESLDFIFIDANHAYDFVKEDINLWFPKLKKGGIFSGHDYINMDWYSDPNFCENKKDKYIYSYMNSGEQIYNGVFGVNPAVDEFCEKFGYTPKVTKEWFGTWWFIK